MTQISSIKLQVEHLRETLGTSTDRPRLSWLVERDFQNWYQTGYEIEVYDADGQSAARTAKPISPPVAQR